MFWNGKMQKNKLKKIFILGASSDIGLETVKLFLRNNWIVTAHYNSNKKKLYNLKKNKNLKLFKFNLLKIEKFEKFITKNKKYFSEFDSFVGLTGYIKFKTLNNFKVQDFHDHFNVNYLSNVLIIKKLLKNMEKRKWGRILLTSSIGTKFGGHPNTFIYSLSKYMNEFFPSYYKKFFKKGILVNCLQIGVTNTKLNKKNKEKNLKKRINLIPIKRMATVNEVAKYIYFLSSEKNSLIARETINISGGE
jgi:3-oxoacyl-[acyl-carrier protein] reductase